MENIKPIENAEPAIPPALKIFTAARVTDLLSRFLPALFFLFIVTVKIDDLVSYILEAGQAGAHSESRMDFYTAVSSRLSVILFLLLMTFLFLVRTPPVKKAGGMFPRVTAIVGTFFMSVITIFPRAEWSVLGSATATLIILVGTTLSIIVLTELGRSFSLMAEARRLVTTGPYAVVRHPLYLAEEIAVLGAVMQFFSLYTLSILAIHLLIQIQRMKNEEAVLREAFPEYLAYQARTARLIPGIY